MAKDFDWASPADLIEIDHTHHFVADTHFGHVGILDQAARPQRDIEAHDPEIIDTGPTDTVWHLGDFAGEDVAFDYVASVFGKLNGRKRLMSAIRTARRRTQSCHRRAWTRCAPSWRPGCKIVLCHYPFREWNGYFGGWDCGVDHQGFSPMTFNDIRALMVELDELDFTGVLAT